MLFLSNFGGFALSLVNPYLAAKVPFGLIMVVAAIIHLLGFVLQAIGGDVRSYGLFVTTFALIGFGARSAALPMRAELGPGSGIQDANANGWVAGLPNVRVALSAKSMQRRRAPSLAAITRLQLTLYRQLTSSATFTRHTGSVHYSRRSPRPAS